MRGEFIGVWPETQREIWEVLGAHEAAPGDLFCELYYEFSEALNTKLSAQALAEVTDNPVQSREAFESTRSEDLSSEPKLVAFLESAQGILQDLGGDTLSNYYFNLLAAFVEKFSLRYDLRRPCTLCPTLPGVFANLLRDLRAVTSQNANLDSRMKDFEDAVRDLRYGCTEGRIKTCIGKQFMLLEAMGASCPGVTKKTLGDICDQVETWPHATIRESLKKLYGFASDYPGIRHGTDSEGAVRNVDMRDMVAISILLAGFTPYLTDLLNADIVYRGS
jgi:hypothetical protein